MVQPGDVVVCPFPGVQGVKSRPAVVVSTDAFHASGADVIVGEVTSRIAKGKQATSYVLQDWQAAGLRQPSVFRAYLATVRQAEVVVIGRLSDHDWQGVQACLRVALAVT